MDIREMIGWEGVHWLKIGTCSGLFWIR